MARKKSAQRMTASHEATPSNSAAEPKVKPVTAKITKNDAVKQALVDLGNDASRAELRDHVMDKFSLDISVDHISTIKSTLKSAAEKGAGKKKEKKAGKRNAHSTTGSKSAAHAGNGKAGGAVSMADITVLNELTGRIGAENLRLLVEMLAR